MLVNSLQINLKGLQVELPLSQLSFSKLFFIMKEGVTLYTQVASLPYLGSVPGILNTRDVELALLLRICQ